MLPQQSTFVDAVAAFQARDYARAESVLRQVIADNPNHVDALSLLGVACNALQQLESSVMYFDRAARLHPDPERLCNLGEGSRRSAGSTPHRTPIVGLCKSIPITRKRTRNFGVCQLRAAIWMKPSDDFARRYDFVRSFPRRSIISSVSCTSPAVLRSDSVGGTAGREATERSGSPL